jgi:hypothetical protein
MPSLLDTAIRRGFIPHVVVMDKGYDGRLMYEACESRGVHPVIPLKVTAGVASGMGPAAVVQARHVDVRRVRRQAAGVQVALPGQHLRTRVHVGQGRPAAHPDPAHHRTVEGALPHPHRRGTRTGNLKNNWGLTPLRVRRIARVRLHADLTILARLSTALANARAAVPLAA